MSKFSATVVITHPNGEKTHELSADTVTSLKHQIYLLSFEDIDGELERTMQQWRISNYIKGKKLTDKKKEGKVKA